MSTKGDRLWGGGYEQETHPLVQRMNASVSYDCRMARQDIIGSIAHATMLCQQELITDAEYREIVDGLREIAGDIERGEFVWSEAREDVHMNIEAALRDRIGAAAGRLHTARSRNDQVALDERLWLRAKLSEIASLTIDLVEALGQCAWDHRDWAMCGYTHLQRAQPITLGHHLLAHVESFERDIDRIFSTLERMDVCPLGAGALAGSTLAIDRDKTAQLLDFSRVARNSLDAVSDRDHLLDTLAAAATSMTHISRIGEELVLFASAEFGYIKLPDAFTTGSSLMPQKKNPDMAELIRGKSGRVYGSLVSLLVTLKGLPLAYNKDMQEDKEALFDAVDTWMDCVCIVKDMLPAARWQRRSLSDALDKGFLLATDLADVLVRNGVAFRESHERVASLVSELVKQGKTFRRAGARHVAQVLGVPEAEVKEALNIRRALRKRDVVGAPHPARVGREAKRVARRVEAYRKRLSRWQRVSKAEQILGH